MIQRMRLGDLLVESSLITESQLKSALEVQKNSGGKKLGSILVDLEVISEEDMLGVLQKKLNTAFVKLSTQRIPETLLGFVPEELAREKNIFPYNLQGNTLYIATSDPLDYETLNQIGVATGKNIEAVIATRNDISMAITKFYNKRSIDTMASALDSTVNVPTAADSLAGVDFDEIESRVGSVPVVKFINNLVLQAHAKRASDIHIEPLEDSVRVRFRIDGEMVEIVRISIKAHASIVTRIKIMSNMDIAEKRIPLDGRFNTEIDGSEVSIRTASMPTVFGEKIVMRLMSDSKTGILPLESLGIQGEKVKALRLAVSNPNGLFLVTGPTGSGKSTTLYSILNEISTANANVLTVEDPIEKLVPGVNQTQVNPKAGLTFASGLRAILRQDPDKIMIGEIRDAETADIAARAAITGHLVLASMHTNSAAGAYMRLVDMGVEPFVVASSILAVIAQRLVRLICPYCKEVYHPTEADVQFIKKLGVSMPEALYHGKGCERCDFTGNLGRTAVLEIIMTDGVLREMIISKAKATDIEAYLTKEKGQRYMLDHAIELVFEGKIFIRELLQLSQLLEF